MSTILGLLGFDPLATFGGMGLSLFGAAAAGPAGIAIWLWRHKWVAVLAAAAIAGVVVAFVVLGLRLTIAKLERDVAREQVKTEQSRTAHANCSGELRLANERIATTSHDLDQAHAAAAANRAETERVRLEGRDNVASLVKELKRVTDAKTAAGAAKEKIHDAAKCMPPAAPGQRVPGPVDRWLELLQ